ncbi:uncharacterized protein LOC123877785 isoform X2 [Maniola jurtina]|uniref:uncharacterized protein LOC123877785 isoform X2 n=1 Tax=Maniola jurtina TaxID=191418 RepID=UPI001E68B500|nr:uncharacterized protein LOC123877785 isoform X2 [Maniola jurtina]
MSHPVSRLSSRVVTISTAEVFEIITEQESSPTSSSVKINATDINDTDTKPDEEKENAAPVIICPCKAIKDAEEEKKNEEEIERLLKEKEIEMEDKFQDRLAHEMQFLKDRFEFILQNEQIRASHMLREARREREEKISALQTQLACKNMAGLMYVLCAERRKKRMEILRLTEEYTNYIQALQQILTESQTLILNLSRGYKTAARVDHEWREKMKKIIKHFQNFVNNFTGCPPEANQYLLNVPELLKIQAPIADNPCEDPCEPEEEESTENAAEKEEADRTWWNTLEGEDRPFVMFGDMADFKPPQRRQVLKAVKAAKTAPKKWKEYVFHDMFLKTNCPNTDVIKEEYFKRVPLQPMSPGERWEMIAQTDKHTTDVLGSDTSRRITTASVDIRGHMGSILKIITSNIPPPPAQRSALLGARDSMEIASSTRLLEKQKHKKTEHGKVVINIGNKISSIFSEMCEEEQEEEEQPQIEPRITGLKDEEDTEDESVSALGSIHKDSLQMINRHVPDLDHKIHYEKICPMEECQKRQMDDFMRSLPSYMHASPFMHFEQTYKDYEACTPEQLEILKQRIEEKKKKERVVIDVMEDDPLVSWTPSEKGIGVQTSYNDMYLPPCTCGIEGSDTSETNQRVYNMVDLIPIKQELERINAECFFNDDIEFNRFKVIGHGDDEYDTTKTNDKDNFNTNRLQEIKKILKQHPSLCELFQANIRC